MDGERLYAGNQNRCHRACGKRSSFDCGCFAGTTLIYMTIENEGFLCGNFVFLFFISLTARSKCDITIKNGFVLIGKSTKNDVCGSGGMADPLVLGTSGQPCRFKSCRPHQPAMPAPNYRMRLIRLRALLHEGGGWIYHCSLHKDRSGAFCCEPNTWLSYAAWACALYPRIGSIRIL